MSAHVATMAPGTNIGAATPISGSGEDIPDDLFAKVLEDTNALLRSISTLRNRNVEWALSTVADARSYTAEEAVEAGGVDGLANSVEEAIAFADGRTVNVNGTDTTLELTGAATTDLPMNPLQALLHLLSDPNIAFILFTVGFYGLIFELQSPNWVTGIVGAIAIMLAFIGFGSLPLNVGGLLLIGLVDRALHPRVHRHQPRPADDCRDRDLRARRRRALHRARHADGTRCVGRNSGHRDHDPAYRRFHALHHHRRDTDAAHADG